MSLITWKAYAHKCTNKYKYDHTNKRKKVLWYFHGLFRVVHRFKHAFFAFTDRTSLELACSTHRENWKTCTKSVKWQNLLYRKGGREKASESDSQANMRKRWKKQKKVKTTTEAATMQCWTNPSKDKITYRTNNKQRCILWLNKLCDFIDWYGNIKVYLFYL